MNKIVTLVSGLLLVCYSGIQAQTTVERKSPTVSVFYSLTESKNNKVKINQEEPVKALFERYVDFRAKDNKIPGYRIRIYSNSGQTALANARSEKAKFESLYSDTTYLVYEKPNYKVYVGDYRTRNQAFVAFKSISKDFKKAFLIPTRINLPKL